MSKRRVTKGRGSASGISFKGEEAVQYECIQFLTLQFPKAKWTSKPLSNLRIGAMKNGKWVTNWYLVKKMKALGNYEGWPDIFIARAANVKIGAGEPWLSHGLAIELKDPEAAQQVFNKRKGIKSDDHIQAQARTLHELAEAGHVACFATGLDEFMKIVRWYLQGSAPPNMGMVKFKYTDKLGQERYFHRWTQPTPSLFPF